MPLSQHAMQKAITCLSVAILSMTGAAGQEPEDESFGFLEMVNLVSLESATYFTFGGYKIAGGEAIPTGGSSGQATIKAGTYPFTASNAGAKPGRIEGEIAIKAKRNSKIVFFDSVKEFKDQSKEHQLRYTILTESGKNEGARLTLVSLLNEEFSSAQINGKRGPADGRKPFLFPVKVGDRITIEAAGSKMDSFEIDDEIHFLCFIFLNPDTGKADLSVVRNEKLEYHPPLEDEESE